VPKNTAEFSIKSLLYPVFLPSFLFSIGEASLIPVIPASAEALGADIPTAGIIAGLGMLGTLFADVPAVKFVNYLGERKAMITAAGLAASGILLAVFAANIWMLSIGIFLTGACHAVFGLARHGFIAEAVPLEKRGRALAILGGTFRGGGFVGPLLGAGVVAIWGVSSVYWLPVVFSLLAGAVLLSTKAENFSDTPQTRVTASFTSQSARGTSFAPLVWQRRPWRLPEQLEPSDFLCGLYTFTFRLPRLPFTSA